jgi:hypothetical protein
MFLDYIQHIGLERSSWRGLVGIRSRLNMIAG